MTTTTKLPHGFFRAPREFLDNFEWYNRAQTAALEFALACAEDAARKARGEPEPPAPNGDSTLRPKTLTDWMFRQALISAVEDAYEAGGKAAAKALAKEAA